MASNNANNNKLPASNSLVKYGHAVLVPERKFFIFSTKLINLR